MSAEPAEEEATDELDAAATAVLFFFLPDDAAPEFIGASVSSLITVRLVAAFLTLSFGLAATRSTMRRHLGKNSPSHTSRSKIAMARRASSEQRWCAKGFEDN
jgi:hypothetical protein